MNWTPVVTVGAQRHAVVDVVSSGLELSKGPEVVRVEAVSRSANLTAMSVPRLNCVGPSLGFRLLSLWSYSTFPSWMQMLWSRQPGRGHLAPSLCRMDRADPDRFLYHRQAKTLLHRPLPAALDVSRDVALRLPLHPSVRPAVDGGNSGALSTPALAKSFIIAGSVGGNALAVAVHEGADPTVFVVRRDCCSASTSARLVVAIYRLLAETIVVTATRTLAGLRFLSASTRTEHRPIYRSYSEKAA